jgi:hypothetical protein
MSNPSLRETIAKFGLDYNFLGGSFTKKDDILAILEALEGTRGRIYMERPHTKCLRTARLTAIKLVSSVAEGHYELVAEADPVHSLDGYPSVLGSVEIYRVKA